MGTLSVKFGFKNESCLNSPKRRMSLFILPNKPFQGHRQDTVLTFCFFWVKPKENSYFFKKVLQFAVAKKTLHRQKAGRVK
jgi:hypothetical protein